MLHKFVKYGRQNVVAGCQRLNRVAFGQMENEGLVWYALFVVSGREFSTQVELKKHGIDCYLPICIRWRRVGRCNGLRTKVIMPAISGCLFFAMGKNDIVKPKLKSANVVGYIVGTNSVLAKLHGGVLKKFIMRNKRQFSFCEKNSMLKVGEKAQIVEGMLRGNCVDIMKIESKTAIVLAAIFGNIRQVKVPLANLEKISL